MSTSVALRHSNVHDQRPASHQRVTETSVKPVDQQLEATLVLRPKYPHPQRHAAVQAMARRLPHERHYLSIEQYCEGFGASREDLEKVMEVIRAHGLHVVEPSLQLSSVTISGRLADFQKFFAVKFETYQSGDCNFRSYEGDLHIPRELENIVEYVLGLDNRALARHHHFLSRQAGVPSVHPSHIAKIYDFPSARNAEGQSIAIIETGGGFHRSDLEAYFAEQHITPPKITVVNVDGTPNVPASKELIGRCIDQEPLNPDQGASVKWTIETTLDIQLAAALAPGARIVVYFCDGTERGQYHAFMSALTDTVNRPSIISCSWGMVESDVSGPFAEAMEPVFEAAALMGVTICVSTGDGFAQEEVAFPSTSPYVLACGGTQLTSNGEHETVWNEEFGKYHMASVGGASALHPEPEWQHSAGVVAKTKKHGRGVPDVAGKADLANGYSMTVGGRDIAMGGASAAAPLWAALLALVNAETGIRTGWITPLLYHASFHEATREITRGSNGVYHAGEGWNPCTGWGSPKGRPLVTALGATKAFQATATGGPRRPDTREKG